MSFKKHLLLHTIIFLLVFCCTVCQLFGQHACTVKNFNTQNGLSQNTITDMMMDANGHLWLGTHTGLIRYNGKNFTDFYFDTTGEAPTRNNVQYIMGIKAQNKLLVRVRSGEVFVVDRERPLLYNDSLKNMGFYTTMHGSFPSLSLFNKFNASTDYLATNQGWDKDKVFLLPLNETGFIVNSKKPSVFYYYKDGAKYRTIKTSNGFKHIFSIGQNGFIADSLGHVYVYDSRLYHFKKIKIDWGEMSPEAPLPEDAKIYSDEYSGNAYCFYNDTFYLLHYNVQQRSIKFIPQFSIGGESRFWTGIIYDSINETFFLSTLNEGFFQVKLQFIKTMSVNKMLPQNIEPIKTINYAVLKTSDSTVVIPSGFEFTDGYNGITVKRMGNLFGNRETIARLPNNNILCAKSENLFHFSPLDNYTVKRAYNDSFNAISRYDITLLWPEGDSVWVGTRRELFCLSPQKLSLAYRFNHDGKGAYTGPCIFYRLNHAEAYISNMQGLFKITTRPPYKADTIATFAKKEVRCITPYKNLRILCVYKQGLFIEKDQKVYMVPLNAQNESLLRCHSVYIDEHENAWIPTDNGLYKTSAEMLVQYALHPEKGFPFFFRLSTDDGIKNIEFNGGGVPSHAVLSSRLFYPSMGGIVTFRPRDINTEIVKSPIFIDKVLIDGVPQLNHRRDSIRLYAGFKYLSIEFAVANFREPENLQMEYKMDEGAWVPFTLSDKMQLSLINIPAGRHQLLVRRRTGFRDTDYVYKSIVIVKERFIYEKPWFYLLLLLLLASITWLIIKFRTQSINRKRAILQKRVDKQTSELSRAVEVKDLLIGIISHEMTTPLKHISLVAGVLQKGFEKDVYRVNEALSDIKLTSDRILSDSISLINWIKYSNKTIPVKKKTIHLHSLIKEVLEIYASLARSKGIQLRNDIEKWRFIEADYTIVSTIFNNIISNAVKYSLQGVITVRCESGDKNSSIIKISDEGTGMSSGTLYKIREVLKGNLKVLKTYDESSTRLGYILVRELLRIHHLHMEVESTLNKGTVVSIVLSETGNNNSQT